MLRAPHLALTLTIAAALASCSDPTLPEHATQANERRALGTDPMGSVASTLYPNLPTGMTVASDNAWDFETTGSAAGWQEIYLPENTRIVDVPDAPASASKALEFVFRAGAKAGFAPDAAMIYNVDSPEIFVGMHFRFTSPWQMLGAELQKLFYLYQTQGDERNDTIIFLEGDNTTGNFGRIKVTSWPGQTTLVAGTGPEITVGAWHKIEVYAKKSSSDGAADGVLRVWIDGQLHFESTTWKLRGTNWKEVHVNPVWGGDGPTIAQEQHLRLDHTVVATGTSSTTTPTGPAPESFVTDLPGSRCMDVPGASRTAGTQLQIWDCLGNDAQAFRWHSDGSIHVYQGTEELCVEDGGGLGQNGDLILVSACNGGAAQRWEFTSNREIRLQGTNQCIDVTPGDPAFPGNGTDLILWECHGGDTDGQQWTRRT